MTELSTAAVIVCVRCVRRKFARCGERLTSLTSTGTIGWRKQVHILPNSQYPARSHSRSLIVYRMYAELQTVLFSLHPCSPSSDDVDYLWRILCGQGKQPRQSH